MTGTVTLMLVALVVVGRFIIVSLLRVDDGGADCSDACSCDDGRVASGMKRKLVRVARADVTYEGKSWFISSVCALMGESNKVFLREHTFPTTLP